MEAKIIHFHYTGVDLLVRIKDFHNNDEVMTEFINRLENLGEGEHITFIEDLDYWGNEIELETGDEKESVGDILNQTLAKGRGSGEIYLLAVKNGREQI